MKLLNVGSGPHYAQGWTNLDLNTHENWDLANGGKGQPDILASVYDMPFEDNTFERAYVGHLLEHLVYKEIPKALIEIRRVVQPGGVILVVGPCLDKAIATRQPRWLLEDIKAHGGGGSGFGHEWTSTEAKTLEVMKIAGLEDATPIDIGVVLKPRWPNPTTAPWQLAIRATA